jgi:hypothetical protein
MNPKPAPQWLKVLGTVVLLVPLLLLAWFFPDASGLFSSSSTERRKPMSAEAKFLWLVFGLLVVVGSAGWLVWHWAARTA